MLNAQTGKPAGASLVQAQLAAFPLSADSLIAVVQKLDKVDQDQLKTDFVTFANGIKDLATHEYKTRGALVTTEQTAFTETMEAQEKAAIETITRKLNEAFPKSQETFAQKHGIQLK